MKLLYGCGACILLLVGCIKDPPFPDPEPPVQSDWLIKRIVHIEAYSQDGSLYGPKTYVKYVHDFLYDAHDKPVSRREYSNYSTSIDTNDLALSNYDTLYYDAQRRLIQLDNFSVFHNRINDRRKFYYEGNSTLIRRYAHFSFNSQQDSLAPAFDLVLAYNDTAVLRISKNLKGELDTSYDVYHRGNYAYWYPSSGGGPLEYSEYDNKPNVERCFNLPQPIAFTLPQAFLMRYRLSRNNWTFRGSGPYSGTWRQLTYDQQGLISSTYTIDYNGPNETFARFEYIPKQ